MQRKVIMLTQRVQVLVHISQAACSGDDMSVATNHLRCTAQSWLARKGFDGIACQERCSFVFAFTPASAAQSPSQTSCACQ